MTTYINPPDSTATTFSTYPEIPTQFPPNPDRISLCIAFLEGIPTDTLLDIITTSYRHANTAREYRKKHNWTPLPEPIIASTLNAIHNFITQYHSMNPHLWTEDDVTQEKSNYQKYAKKPQINQT